MSKLGWDGWRLLPIVIVALLLPHLVSAQAVTGTISGTVADPQGQVIPGATITVISEANNDSRVAVSDDKGDFQVTNLQPGMYTVRVALESFRTLERKNVVLSAAERLSVGTLALEVGGIGETVVVEARGTHVNTAETQHSGVITATQIEQVQVLGRDVTSIMRLLPGVRYENTVDSLGMSFGTNVPNVGGARRDWSNVVVDGVVANEVGNSSLMAQQINLDAIAEVRVLLNSYRAEYGRAGGGQVQIVSKGGGTKYRGNLYYYGRNEMLNANNFFNNRSNIKKPRYRFNTYGGNLGGPVPGLDSKLFFFYSIEAPIVSRPGPARNWTMPTDREMQGDFSQTLDSQGRLINIKDPLREGACNAVTGGPGCFPGNIIPSSRINSNGRALLNMLPRANNFDRAFTQGQFNYTTQENATNPKMNNIVRVDWRPSSTDSFYFTFKDWYSDQRGSEITAGPNKWGFFNTHYLNTDRGVSANYTKVLRSNLVSDTDFGTRQQTEQFYPLTQGDWDRITRSNVGFNLGQFHPELNPRNVIPKVNFNVPNAPNFTFDNRLVDQGEAWLTSVRSNLTWIKGSHSLKAGVYVEQSRNSEGNGGVGAGPWAGQFTFNTDTSNPFDTNYSYANALIGSFQNYTEIDKFSEVKGSRMIGESYIQDTWKASRRLTLDFGVRFLWYQPWFSKELASVFVPERYDPAKAARLYQPARINGVNVALDPATGQTLLPIFVGTFVPGVGDRYNGMVSSDDPAYPRGFRDSQGIEPEPRLGLAWDIAGDGKTALHSSVGLYHNPHVNANGLDAMARNPPAQNTPQIIYGTMDTLLSAGAQGAFANRPSSVFGIERDAKTPKSYNYSVGVQREVGWGTVIDVTYAGFQMRNAEMSTNINPVPDGARFLDVNPQNADPRNPASAKPSEFLRPYTGYQDITIRSHFGTAYYNSLQVQLNRRYIGGLQFAVAYTLAKTVADGTSYNPLRPGKAWNEAPEGSTQFHNFIMNYTWDVPNGSRMWNNLLTRGLLDGWQVSGDTALVSGDWAGASTSTTDNFDFTGGDGGTRPRLVGDPVCSSNCDPTPGTAGSYLNTAAFGRLAGRGDYGNAPRTFFRLPKIVNSNISAFKNFTVGGKRLQFRWEMYNVFNQVNWSNINTNAQFNPAGEQVNANFGKATAARDPRIMQGALRFTF
ncbi:MAG: carboxypeptidase regulatory-like domain-containing protein [Acidobacteriota bacterium]|nr:carboxypeptidase regulatory-like domain-containing protein [Acidobacteriota bacterium]